MSDLLASLGHTGKRRVVLGHILNTLCHVITKKSHNVLSKFTILCWTAFIAILGPMLSAGCGLDTPGQEIHRQVEQRGGGALSLQKSILRRWHLS